MASLLRKVKASTRRKIVHSAFALGHDILDAIEEQVNGDESPAGLEEEGDPKRDS
jgi:hypothetical protein